MNLGYKFSGNNNQTVRLNQTIGKVDAIIINEDKSLSGGADHRGDDHTSGF